MAKVGKSGLQIAVPEYPGAKRETLLDVAVRRKEVLVARSVVEEVRRRVLQFRGDSKGAREKDERVKDDKMEEKARAAAWAWYQHGKGGKESISTSGGPVGGASTPSVRSGGSLAGSLHKSSRFKTEALKSSFRNDSPHAAEPSPSWDFPTTPSTSSLFDSYELDSVSRRIDSVFQSEISTAVVPAAPPPITSTPKLARTSSLRMQFPRNICRSIADVVTREEMALGVDIRKCECRKDAAGRNNGWSFRRLSKAIQVFMHLPECEYHPQREHLERRQAREHRHEHHHHHEHEHHHIHYQVKLRDGNHYGNSFSKVPGKSDVVAEISREKEYPLFSRLSPKLSPKVSPKLF